jgi:hypothetical protein
VKSGFFANYSQVAARAVHFVPMIQAAKRLNTRRVTVAFLALLALGLFIGWYAVAANYDYSALAGVYVLNQDGERCVLDLRTDRSFTEELTQPGNIQRVAGTWHRYGQAHVSFSREFLKVSGQELNAGGEAHGQFQKSIGLFPALTLAPLPNGPQLHKRLFGLR